MEDLGTVGGQPVLDDIGGVNRSIIPEEEPLLFHQDRPLLLQCFMRMPWIFMMEAVLTVKPLGMMCE